jgi:hypothetical protein
MLLEIGKYLERGGVSGEFMELFRLHQVGNVADGKQGNAVHDGAPAISVATE